MQSNNLKRGALLMLAAGLLFAGMGALVKTVSVSLPNEMVVFFRNAFGLLVLLPWLAHRGSRRLKTAHFRVHLVRGLAGLAGMYCYFYAIAHIGLAEATLFNYTTPLFIPFIALFWLGEGIPAKLWGAIALGFFGIVLVLKPGLDIFTPVSLIGLSSGMLAALAMVSIRRLTRTESATRIVFYFSVIGTVVSAVPLLWSWQTPVPQIWGLLVAMGALASAAQLLMTRAYAQAPAAQVGPFVYTIVLFAGLIGWVLWDEVPDGFSLLGGIMICLAGVLTIHLSGRLAPLPEVPKP